MKHSFHETAYKSANNSILVSSANVENKLQGGGGGGSGSGSTDWDFKNCQVRTGEETTIEIVREKLGLGLSIVGGSDTHLVQFPCADPHSNC